MKHLACWLYWDSHSWEPTVWKHLAEATNPVTSKQANTTIKNLGYLRHLSSLSRDIPGAPAKIQAAPVQRLSPLHQTRTKLTSAKATVPSIRLHRRDCLQCDLSSNQPPCLGPDEGIWDAQLGKSEACLQAFLWQRMAEWFGDDVWEEWVSGLFSQHYSNDMNEEGIKDNKSILGRVFYCQLWDHGKSFHSMDHSFLIF